MSPFMTLIASNKKAYQNYFLSEKMECGLSLTGGEVKSLRAGEVNFSDSFAYFDHGELYLFNLHINPYPQASYMNDDPLRKRKLLVHKKELKRLIGTLAQKRVVLVPTRLYFNKRGIAKLELAQGQGKKLYDKRQDIKERTMKREVDRAVRNRGR